MDAWAAVGAIGSVAAAAVAAWAAYQSRASAQQANRAATTLARIEEDRRHAELCPRFRVLSGPIGQADYHDTFRLRLVVVGPPPLGQLDRLTVTIRDDFHTRGEGFLTAGGPSESRSNGRSGARVASRHIPARMRRWQMQRGERRSTKVQFRWAKPSCISLSRIRRHLGRLELLRMPGVNSRERTCGSHSWPNVMVSVHGDLLVNWMSATVSTKSRRRFPSPSLAPDGTPTGLGIPSLARSHDRTLPPKTTPSRPTVPEG